MQDSINILGVDISKDKFDICLFVNAELLKIGLKTTH